MRRKFVLSVVAVASGLLLFVAVNFALYGYYQSANAAALSHATMVAERVEGLRERASALQAERQLADPALRQQLESRYADTVDGYNAVFEQWQLLRAELPPRRDLLLFWE